MSIYKGGKTWWTDFSVNGQRFRESLDTTDWREAQTRQKELIGKANAGRLAHSGERFARLAFGDAADRYLQGRRLELSAGSLKKERQLLVQPRRFFGARQLLRISPEDLQTYRERRAESGSAPSYINMEMGTICRILKCAKRWHLVAADIKPLRERRDVGRAMSHDERLRLLGVAACRAEWQIARCATVLALNTTMRGGELKGLRWRDVNMLDRVLTVWRSKTEAGERVIPLNDQAMAVMLELYKRAQAMGGYRPHPLCIPRV